MKGPATRPRPVAVLRRFLANDQLILLVLALVIGTAAAYGAIAFRQLYLHVQLGAFGTTAESLASHARTLPAWQIVLAPALGGLVIGLLVHYVMPGRRPHAVPDVMESVALHGGRVGVREGIGAAVVSAASIGVGASVGREGPVVHLGAFIGSWIADRLGLSRAQAVTLLGCGVAAAISTSFNAPIAGVFFALEVVIGHYALSAFAPIVIASVFGTIISRIHFGDFPAFSVPDHNLVSFLEFPAFALLGVISAIMAIIFLRSAAFTATVVERIPLPRWMMPMLAGALVGVIALGFPQVLGVGYEATDGALKGVLPLALLLALILAKTVATVICLGSGFGGGVFSPSLFLGAMLGGAYGLVATVAFPGLSSGHTAYTLVGMGAVAGSVLGAPISTILIVFEMTADYALTIAVMVAVVIASVITQQVHGRSFFSAQLLRRGIDLNRIREIGRLVDTTVRDLMGDSIAAVSRAVELPEIREKLQSVPYGRIFVIEDDGALYGTITLADLHGAAFDASIDPVLRAGDVARRHPPCLEQDEDIQIAIERMLEVGDDCIAVVDGYGTMKLVGFVSQVEIMQAYTTALMQARRRERGAA